MYNHQFSNDNIKVSLIKFQLKIRNFKSADYYIFNLI